jgi:hypothetical protein
MKLRLAYLKVLAIQIYMSVKIMASLDKLCFGYRCSEKGFEWKAMNLHSY